MTNFADPHGTRALGRALYRRARRSLVGRAGALAMAQELGAPMFEFVLAGPDRGLLRPRWRWELFEARVPFATGRARTSWTALEHILLGAERRARAELGDERRAGTVRRFYWAYGDERLLLTADGVSFRLRPYFGGPPDDEAPPPAPAGDPLGFRERVLA